jgi:YebC/PmpR family DNA-binding regulatory protein
MAGHSKWANIRYRKGAQDAKRGKVFTKLIREITVASKLGGGDQNSNPRLRDAITRANKANMKKDTIENAIKKGTGKLEGVNYVEITYEGYGPYSVAILIECLTDNKNRTVSEVRHAFSKNNGNLGADGSVSYLFNKVGQLIFEPPITEEQLFDVVTEYECEDIETQEDGSIVVTVSKENYHDLLVAVENLGYIPCYSDITVIADRYIALEGENAQSVIKLIDALEDLDDVQNVYSNAEFPQELE